MPIWGIGITAGILVGQRLGENRSDLAERSAWTSIALGLTYMTAISLLYVFAPSLFVSGFFAAANEEAAAADASRELAITLLRFVAAYNLFDALFMILSSVIKGAGDTHFVMWTSLVASIVLGSTSFLIIRQGGGVFACWTLVTLWVCALGFVFFLRFRGGKWKSMRVIDMQNH
jgi:MATE family multidrug resistance protein